jgi:hypothetical protein
MLKRIFLFTAVLCLLYSACTKEKNAPAAEFYYNFYPLKVGSVIIYDADSTAFSNFTNTSVNYKFEIKDSLTHTFNDLAGQTHYRIERYKRINPSTIWIFQQVFTRNITSRAAEEFINNERFTRLIFPPTTGSSWNGNSKNVLGEQEYLIESGIEPLMVNNLTFDSTIVVKEIDEFNLIREDLVYSTYATNVGLIKKEVTAVDKNISTGRITNGLIYSLKIKSFK